MVRARRGDCSFVPFRMAGLAGEASTCLQTRFLHAGSFPKWKLLFPARAGGDPHAGPTLNCALSTDAELSSVVSPHVPPASESGCADDAAQEAISLAGCAHRGLLCDVHRTEEYV